MKISNETKVGVLASISITILILGYNFMKGENLFTSYNTYYSYYDDVEGLFKSNPVMVNGYKVGQVSDVKMDPESLKIMVEIKVPDHIKVTKDAVIKIVNTDLIGSKGTHLIMGTSSEYARSGDTLKADKDQGMAKAIGKLIMPLSEKINILLTELNDQISGNQIKTTLENLNKTLNTAEKAIASVENVITTKNGKLDAVLADLNSMTTDLKASTPMVKNILGDLNETSNELKEADLKGTIASLKSTIEEVNATFSNINKGQGSIGKLATDEALYKKLDLAIENMNKLIVDIEKYPSRYTGITNGQRRKADKKKKKAGD
ncbi:MAG: MCE family protein [Flavobacteriales bacterium]|nr:MCE family protein [Flavobacteriales bacterium]